MAPVSVGSPAPEVLGIPQSADPRVLFFYKVTCPVCQMAAPKVERFSAAHPGRVVGVGQDPPGKLAAFGSTYGLTFDTSEDPPPYPASDAYGIEVVPTLVLVAGGVVVDLVESWDRDGLNALAHQLSELTGEQEVPISTAGDGLPPFRPG